MVKNGHDVWTDDILAAYALVQATSFDILEGNKDQMLEIIHELNKGIRFNNFSKQFEHFHIIAGYDSSGARKSISGHILYGTSVAGAFPSLSCSTAIKIPVSNN